MEFILNYSIIYIKPTIYNLQAWPTCLWDLVYERPTRNTYFKCKSFNIPHLYYLTTNLWILIWNIKKNYLCHNARTASRRSRLFQQISHFNVSPSKFYVVCSKNVTNFKRYNSRGVSNFEVFCLLKVNLSFLLLKNSHLVGLFSLGSFINVYLFIFCHILNVRQISFISLAIIFQRSIIKVYIKMKKIYIYWRCYFYKNKEETQTYLPPKC